MSVFPSDGGHWGATVDGFEVGARFPSSHGAWAAGVAECYRRDPGTERRTLAVTASRAAARQRLSSLGA